MLAVAGRWEEAAAGMRDTANALQSSSPRLLSHCLFELSYAEMNLGLWQSAKETSLQSAKLQAIDMFKAVGLARAAYCASRMGELDEARALVGRAMELREQATLTAIPGFEGIGIDDAFAQALAAVGEEESARAFLRQALAIWRAGADDLTDPDERAGLLACPYFRPLLDLAGRLGVSM